MFLSHPSLGSFVTAAPRKLLQRPMIFFGSDPHGSGGFSHRAQSHCHVEKAKHSTAPLPGEGRRAKELRMQPEYAFKGWA